MPRKCTRKAANEEDVVHAPKKLCFTKTKVSVKQEKTEKTAFDNTAEDFLIAKKKLQQIQAAMESKDVIVLEGPPGCGKTWTMRKMLDAKFIDFDWLDYKNESAIVSFLKRCLFLQKEGETVRIMIDNADGMQEALIRVMLVNRFEGQKLYFIFNIIEPKSLFKEEDNCEVTQLNPLTAAAIKKLLSEVPTKVANEIAELCDGDARVALSLADEHKLHGALLRHSRDSTLEFFHSIGKVLYPRKDPEAIWQLGHLEEEEFSLFNSYLHFNCLESISPLENLAAALDAFSLSQNNFYLREHPARFVSLLVNSGKKRKSNFGFHKPPPFYFKPTLL